MVYWENCTLQFSRMHIVIISKTTKSNEFQKVLLSNISSIHFRQTAKIHFLSIHTDTYISITYLFMSQVLISFILMYSFIVLFLQYKVSASTQNASLYTNFGSHTDPSTFFFWLNTLTLYLEYKGRRRKMLFTKGGTEQFGEKKNREWIKGRSNYGF